MTITFTPVYLPQNKGLGNALREALRHCTCDLVARMDSDDISAPYRFEKQLDAFRRDPALDIVGGAITEFTDDPSHIIGVRDVRETDAQIKADMKRRCAMNHVSVMFKKAAVEAAGGYLDWFCNEDYYLWIRMAEHGCKFANLPLPIVNVRTGMGMSARRGGWAYFQSERGLQRYLLTHGMIRLPRYAVNVAVRFAGEFLAPNALRALLYKLVRKRYVPPAPEETASGNVSDPAAYPPFSVAMSVYRNDDPAWLSAALGSIIRQTVPPAEIILVVDGPIPDPLRSVITQYTALLG